MRRRRRFAGGSRRDYPWITRLEATAPGVGDPSQPEIASRPLTNRDTAASAAMQMPLASDAWRLPIAQSAPLAQKRHLAIEPIFPR